MRKETQILNWFKLLSSTSKGQIILFATIASLLFSTSSAQVKATFIADSNKIEIGDHLNFKLAVECPKNTLIELPNFPGDTIGRLEVINKGKVDTASKDENLFITQTITVSAFDSGIYQVPAIGVFFMNQSKTTDSVFTTPSEIIVTTLAVDTSQPFKPIKAPMDVPYKLSEFKWWIAAAAIILAAIIGYLLYRRYKKKKPVTEEKPRPKEPAHIWALNELNKLDAEKLWQNDQHKKYYSRLSDILRQYLEYRFDVYAMESTTDEIERLTESLSLKSEFKNRLLETLRLADFVKFAKMTPLPDQNMRSMENAKAFVEYSKPNEQELLNQQNNSGK